jgi:hypothetical protein
MGSAVLGVFSVPFGVAPAPSGSSTGMKVAAGAVGRLFVNFIRTRISPGDDQRAR